MKIVWFRWLINQLEVTMSSTSTLYAFISDLSCIDKLEVEESFALSDHINIKVLLRCPVVRITSKTRTVYSKANYEAKNKEIRNQRIQ